MPFMYLFFIFMYMPGGLSGHLNSGWKPCHCMTRLYTLLHSSVLCIFEVGSVYHLRGDLKLVFGAAARPVTVSSGVGFEVVNKVHPRDTESADNAKVSISMSYYDKYIQI